VSLNDKAVFARLREVVRPDHVVIDLARIPESSAWPCRVEGLCW